MITHHQQVVRATVQDSSSNEISRQVIQPLDETGSLGRDKDMSTVLCFPPKAPRANDKPGTQTRRCYHVKSLGSYSRYQEA